MLKKLFSFFLLTIFSFFTSFADDSSCLKSINNTTRPLLVRSLNIYFEYFNQVKDKGSYWLIQSPDNPSFNLGNSIIVKGGFRYKEKDQWIKVFKDEFHTFNEVKHIHFAWDSLKRFEEREEFEKSGFDIIETLVMSTNKVLRPEFFNDNYEMREFKSLSDYEQMQNLHFLVYQIKSDWQIPLKNFFLNIMLLQKKNLAKFYGVFDLKGKLVSSLGLLYKGDFAYFLYLNTHPKFRRQGLAQGLLYFAAQNLPQIKTFVLDTKADGMGVNIYKQLGFEKKEWSVELYWREEFGPLN